jgi:Tol biopolymer transport system component
MSEAVEYAHERGIVHRDLKPANVKVAGDDTVKILDFGLAKALETEAPTAALSHSPTISRMATQAGVLLGTAAYMSPEQAKGRPVDRRADVWAFGCVLYEMLTGRTAFGGEAVSDTLAAVIRGEPDWSLLPAATPPAVRVLLERCLQKEPRRRLQAMGDARLDLEDVLSGTLPRVAPSPPARPSKWSLASGLAGAVAVATVAALVAWNVKPSPTPPRPVTRFTITLPPGQRLAGLERPAVALSADGSELAYVAATEGGRAQRIYVRAMDSLEARPVPGTEGATNPFFSPDGQWLGFLAGQTLKRIPIRGGVAQTLTDVVGGPGASWSSQHTIAFAPYSSALQQIPDAGGAARPLTRFEAGETYHGWPEFLPGGKAVLFSAYSASPTAIAVQSTDGGQRRNLIRGPVGEMPRYVPSGHLVYAQAGNLMAVLFDLAHLKTTGQGVPVVEGVLGNPLAPQYNVSAEGSLVYVCGSVGAQAGESRMVWVSRNGMEQPLGARARVYNQPRLSPDGRRVAVDVVEGPQAMQVWLYDLGRDTLAPFTFQGTNRHAVWTPDGKRIAFMSKREGATQIYWQLADGSGGLERLTDNPPTTTADILDIPYSWSPDGHRLIFVKLAPTTEAEFWVLRRDGPGAGSGQGHEAHRFSQTRTMDGAPELSPDGHWLAYASEESGQREIYVQAFPGPGGRWQVSADGGNEPRWNPNGRELFYRSGDRMMAVDVSTRGGFAAGKPRRLFAGDYVRTFGGYVRAQYDVSPDGGRFLMLKPVEHEETPLRQINVVLNWSEELKRLVPSTGR